MSTPDAVYMALKVPPEFLDKLDQWRERQIGKPSRPASIRWITYQFLLREEERTARKAKRAAKPQRPAKRRAA
jgi:hypothetical protein